MSYKEYCPISVKDEKNLPAFYEFATRNNMDIFLSKKNKAYMTEYIISQSKPACFDYNKMYTMIPQLMDQWAADNDIYKNKGAYRDLTQVLEYTNSAFLNKYKDVFKKPRIDHINVFRMKDLTTDACGNEHLKKYNEMTAADYHTLNLWDDSSREIFSSNRTFRDCNRLPVWQKSMSVRHYDLSNDGLHDAISGRASLETPIGKYDMSNIIKGSTNYENYYYDHL